MFAELNAQLGALGYGVAPPPVFQLEPVQHAAYLEQVWDTWRRLRGAGPGLPTSSYPSIGGLARFTALNAIDPFYLVNGVPILGAVAAAAVAASIPLPSPWVPGRQRPWQHLMYAYLVENTRAYDIFERIVGIARRDEAFGPLSDDSHNWLRCTEDLFFRDGPSGGIASLTSWVRSDLRQSRRNAYQRLFGMDLNHAPPQDDALRPTITNADFVRTFEELLRQLWRGYENRMNAAGPNRTDDAAIQDLILRLRDMLVSRRSSLPIASARTNLAREELVFVSMMSWFHLTLASNAPIVVDLQCASPSVDEVLRRLGERVKLPAHSRSRNFFYLAVDLPPLLSMIEDDAFTVIPVNTLYQAAGPLQTMVLNIINHWQAATGVDLKTFGTASQA